IAKWDGSSWSALGSGMNGTVNALAVSDSNLYAAGAGSVSKWDGSRWSALGSGMNKDVSRLGVSGSNVDDGGSLRTAANSGGATVRVNYIVKWDGSSWSALGSGMNNTVAALAVSGTNLYAGGGFTRATNSGGAAVVVTYIAKWNGSSWSPLGSGM